MIRPSRSKKNIAIEPQKEREFAREAECSIVMIRHVMKWGLGRNPSIERSRAYRVLQLHGKVP
jgi:hypothetical protein